MEVKLQELIEQIKKDGVEAAALEAEAIIKAANEETERIVSEATLQAKKTVLEAKKENERTVKAAEDAMRQAGRNVLISFRESVEREVSALISENVNAVYSSEDFASVIVSAIESFAENPEEDDISVLLCQSDLDRLESAVLSHLKDKMINGVTFKVSDGFDSGFGISVKDGTYYDYSGKAVSDMLSNYLDPKVAQLLKEAE